MPSVIEEINSVFRNKKFAEAVLDEGTLVLHFQHDPEDLNQEDATISVAEVAVEDVSYNDPNP